MSHFDVLIRNGRIVDGTGNPWRYGDLLIKGDRIASIALPGSTPVSQAKEVVDAAGRMVCPGFIDIMSHSILSLLKDGRSLSKITQGVTTEIMGEGNTPAPAPKAGPEAVATFYPQLREWADLVSTWSRFSDWLETMEQRGVSVNVGSFLGGGTLRRLVRDMDPGPSTEEELQQMRQIMAQAMEDGAFGVAYALIYPPNCFVDTNEIIEVCKVVQQYGGIYINHMRSEGHEIMEAVQEVFQIGREAKIPVQIYHLKAASPSNWHLMPSVIEAIEEARAQGLDVTADMYPYTASGTGLNACLPTWLSEGGNLFGKLADPEIRAKVYQELASPTGDLSFRLEDRSKIIPLGFERPENQIYVGKSIQEISEMRGTDWINTILDLLVSEGQRIFTVYFSISEDNIRKQLQLPWIQISTDAAGMDPKWAKLPTHPRSYGTYTRVLGRYVREEKLLSFEEAVRKMTSAPANRLGLMERGRLAPNMYADVIIVDQDKVIDRSTFTDSHQLSIGVDDVWVNGQRVLANGQHTGALPGKFVRGPGAKKSK